MGPRIQVILTYFDALLQPQIDCKCFSCSFFYSEFDLYTKSDSLPDLEALTPYYQSLIDKYIPGTVRW